MRGLEVSREREREREGGRACEREQEAKGCASGRWGVALSNGGATKKYKTKKGRPQVAQRRVRCTCARLLSPTTKYEFAKDLTVVRLARYCDLEAPRGSRLDKSRKKKKKKDCDSLVPREG